MGIKLILETGRRGVELPMALDKAEGKIPQGTMNLLLRAGLTAEELRIYLEAAEKQGAEEVKIRMLRRVRSRLLDKLHEIEECMAQIDFILWEMKKKESV